jgi:hypothetical protein
MRTEIFRESPGAIIDSTVEFYFPSFSIEFEFRHQRRFLAMRRMFEMMRKRLTEIIVKYCGVVSGSFLRCVVVKSGGRWNHDFSDHTSTLCRENDRSERVGSAQRRQSVRVAGVGTR